MTLGQPRASLGNRQRHWEGIYRTKPEDELSWHQDRPRVSLQLILQFATPDSRVIDVGGGSSTLASELRRAGLRRVTVLDISHRALDRSRERAGDSGFGVRYRVGDVTRLPSMGRYDVWHDRAVFHFLTAPRDRRHYVDLAAKTVPVGGHLILSTFAPAGPEKCSGLPVLRYDAAGMAAAFTPRFVAIEGRAESHRTPWGSRQAFSYVVLRRVRGGRA